MEILAPDSHIFRIANSMVRKTALPHRELRTQTMRESSLNQTQCSLDCDDLRRDDEMNMVRHDHECVKFIAALMSIVLQCFKKKLSVCRQLEKTPTIERRCCDEEGTVARCSGRDRHTAILRCVPQGLKPFDLSDMFRHG